MADNEAARLSRWALLPGGILVLASLASRLAPLFDQGGRLFRQFPTEDGYLMLTIGRCMAQGQGMAVAGGAIPTNGTQPLATVLWAACFRLVGSDPWKGVFAVLLLQVAIACGAAWALYRLGRLVLQDRDRAVAVAWLAAAVWFASAPFISHTMNCLETGTYALFVTVTMAYYLRLATAPSPIPMARYGLLGVLLGLAFLTRNDACLFILALCLTHVGWSLLRRESFRQRLAETLVMGSVSVVVALPWLVFNRVRFGSIMPISGQAESLEAKLGGNLVHLPAALAEYVMTILPVPYAIQDRTVVTMACCAVLFAALAIYAILYRRAGEAGQRLAWIIGLFAVFLSAFYGLFFGASHFVSRYFFPLPPFLALAWAGCAYAVWRYAGDRLGHRAAAVMPALLVVLVLGLQARLYLQGTRHMHFQVVEWVAQNVREDEWVGAIQSGTCGFFHERTINLDGKVNPAALEARRRDGIPAYVAESEIRYLVDWIGISKFAALPPLDTRFELIVNDPGRNLAVLKRK